MFYQSVCHFHLIIHSVSVISVLVSLPNDSYASTPEIDFCHSSLPVTLHPLFFKFKDCMFIWGLFLLQGLFIFHWIPCSVSSSRFYSYKRKVSVDEWNKSNSSSNAQGIHCWNIIFTDLPVFGVSWWLISVQIHFFFSYRVPLTGNFRSTPCHKNPVRVLKSSPLTAFPVR